MLQLKSGLWATLNRVGVIFSNFKWSEHPCFRTGRTMQKCPSKEDPPCYPTMFVLDSDYCGIGALPQDKGLITVNTACAGCGPWCCAHLHAACFLRTCTWPRASVLPWKPFTWAVVGHRRWIVVLSRQKAPAPSKVFSTKDGYRALLMHNYLTVTSSRSLSCIHHAGYHQEQELFIQTWKGC